MPFKKIFLAAATGVIAITFSFYQASAATEATTTNSIGSECQLDKALNRLLEVKDSDLATGEREAAELSARKDLLGEIIICSSIEIDALRAKLSGLDLSKNNERDSLLRNKFEGDLDAAAFYYHAATDSLDKTELTLDEVKTAAKDMLAWRESFYAPLITKVNNFLLVIESAEAIKTAKTRFQKISSTLGAVKLREVREIKRLLNESDTLIKKSEELNGEAHGLVWSIESVFESPSSTAATSSEETGGLTGKDKTPTTIATSTDETQPLDEIGLASGETASTTPKAAPKAEDQVLTLVKESLGNIKGAYANYLAISSLVRKILGL